MIKKSTLKSIFRLKKNFAPGIPPPARCFSGVQITPFRGGALASATISADFELSWAWRGWRSAEETRERATRERLDVPHLIGLLEEYGIPITWATVGHLFLEGCGRGEDGRAHPQIPRPPVMVNPPAMCRWTGDWYRHDPCTDYHLFFFSSRRRHTRWTGDWSSDVCSSDLSPTLGATSSRPASAHGCRSSA